MAKHIAQFTYVLSLPKLHTCKENKNKNNAHKENKADKSRHREKSQRCLVQKTTHIYIMYKCTHRAPNSCWHCLMHSVMCAREYFAMWNGSLLLYQKKREKLATEKGSSTIVIYNFLDTGTNNDKRCTDTRIHDDYCTKRWNRGATVVT